MEVLISKMMQTNDIYNTCLDISNVLNAGDISNARSKVITLLHEINGTNNNSYMELVNHLIREVGLLPYIDTYTALGKIGLYVKFLKLILEKENLVSYILLNHRY